MQTVIKLIAPCLVICFFLTPLAGEDNKKEKDPKKDSSEQEKVFQLAPVDVTGQRPLSAASDQTVRNRDFMNFPRKSASDLCQFLRFLFGGILYKLHE